MPAFRMDHIESVAGRIDDKYAVAVHGYGLGMRADKGGVADRCKVWLMQTGIRMGCRTCQ